jgi:hypothetical protein
MEMKHAYTKQKKQVQKKQMNTVAKSFSCTYAVYGRC